jgi:hypothetical protein
MENLLLELNGLKIEYGGVIPLHIQKLYRKRYKGIIKFGYKSTGDLIIKRPPLQKKEKEAENQSQNIGISSRGWKSARTVFCAL